MISWIFVAVAVLLVWHFFVRERMSPLNKAHDMPNLHISNIDSVASQQMKAKRYHNTYPYNTYPYKSFQGHPYHTNRCVPWYAPWYLRKRYSNVPCGFPPEKSEKKRQMSRAERPAWYTRGWKASQRNFDSGSCAT